MGGHAHPLQGLREEVREVSRQLCSSDEVFVLNLLFQLNHFSCRMIAGVRWGFLYKSFHSKLQGGHFLPNNTALIHSQPWR